MGIDEADGDAVAEIDGVTDAEALADDDAETDADTDGEGDIFTVELVAVLLVLLSADGKEDA